MLCRIIDRNSRALCEVSPRTLRLVDIPHNATDWHPEGVSSSAGQRTRTGQALFHSVGIVLTAGVVVVGFFAAVIVSFGTSTCGEDLTVGVGSLRLGLAIIGMVITCAPLSWAVLAKVWHRAWKPWAATAAASAVATAVIVASTDTVAYWCF